MTEKQTPKAADIFRGVPAYILAQAMNRLAVGTHYVGCTKGHLYECLDGTKWEKKFDLSKQADQLLAEVKRIQEKKIKQADAAKQDLLDKIASLEERMKTAKDNLVEYRRSQIYVGTLPKRQETVTLAQLLTQTIENLQDEMSDTEYRLRQAKEA